MEFWHLQSRVWFLIVSSLWKKKTSSNSGVQRDYKPFVISATSVNHHDFQPHREFARTQIWRVFLFGTMLWGFKVLLCVGWSWDLSKFHCVLSQKEALKLWNWLKESYFLLMQFIFWGEHFSSFLFLSFVSFFPTPKYSQIVYYFRLIIFFLIWFYFVFKKSTFHWKIPRQ